MQFLVVFLATILSIESGPRFDDDEVPGLEGGGGDEVYCRQNQGRGKGKFASWSWGVCNEACLSEDGSELLLCVMIGKMSR